MNRIKSFDATGIAPNGRLYAGDLNLLQDTVAALADFGQNIQAASIALGDSSLSISKFGTGELQVSNLLRVLGIFRAASGFLTGSYTTTARDAIAAGSRPYGLTILNSTTNRYEWNSGTDAVPAWIPLGGGYGAGVIIDFAGPAASIPSGTVLCDGAQYAQAGAMAGLFAKIGTNWNTFGGLPAPSAGNFRVPDLRGRGTVGHVNMNAGAAPTIAGNKISAASTLYGLVGEELHTLVIGEIPSHDHGAVTGVNSVDHTHTGTTAGQSADHNHSGATGTDSVDHTHGMGGYALSNVSTNTGYGGGGGDGIPTGTSTGGASSFHTHNFTSNGVSVGHTHTYTTSGASATHTHSISAQGGGGAHNVVHPVAVVNKVITTL